MVRVFFKYITPLMIFISCNIYSSEPPTTLEFLKWCDKKGSAQDYGFCLGYLWGHAVSQTYYAEGFKNGYFEGQFDQKSRHFLYIKKRTEEELLSDVVYRFPGIFSLSERDKKIISDRYMGCVYGKTQDQIVSTFVSWGWNNPDKHEIPFPWGVKSAFEESFPSSHNCTDYFEPP